MDAAEMPLWILITHWTSRLVLVILFGLSIWSIATMIQCARLLREAGGGKATEDIFSRFQVLIREGRLREQLKSLGETSLYYSVLNEAVHLPSQEPLRIDRSVKSLLSGYKKDIERGLTILATLGANAPFIGLFGTVLGIIQAFGALGSNQGSGSSVMVGISEALVATAVGLFVAIPAVIAFNFLSRQLRVLIVNSESLRDLYISRLKS